MNKELKEYIRQEYDKVYAKKLTHLQSMARRLEIKGYLRMNAHNLRYAIMYHIHKDWKFYVGLINELEQN